jgi:hypothetical protein
VARKYRVARQSIRTIWTKARVTRERGRIYSPELNSLKKERGRNTKYSRDDLNAAIREIPLTLRRNLRTLAKRLQVSTNVLVRFKKAGEIRTHTSALKPTLTEFNEIQRVEYALSFVDEATMKFKLMYDMIHVDEKWFFISKDQERYYMCPEEEDPVRTVKHKNHICKVMFLCAVARPRFDNGRNQWFDGKLGLWPVGVQGTAQRSSANRPAGTPVWRNINVTRDVYRSMLIEQLFPAIQQKWPVGPGPIIIQQDGAKAHINNNDQLFIEAATLAGLPIRMTTQPPNSPDTNICDLGFFRAIDSANNEVSYNELELIQNIQMTFDGYDAQYLNNIWLTWMSCLNKIVEHHGKNDYRIPHMGKDRLLREERLPLTLPAGPEIVRMLTHPPEGSEDEDGSPDDDLEGDAIVVNLFPMDDNNS